MNQKIKGSFMIFYTIIFPEYRKVYDSYTDGFKKSENIRINDYL